MTTLLQQAAAMGLGAPGLQMSARPQTEIRIVGAGIAGLASAIALRQAGFSPSQVLLEEKAQALRLEGAGLQLSRNGLLALQALGIRDLSGVWVQRVAAWSWSGERPLSGLSTSADSPRLCTSRAALASALQQRANSLGLQTHYNSADAARRARDWALAAPGRLVIGADGVGSEVRRLCLPPRRSIEAAGLALRAHLRLAPDVLGELGTPEARLWMGPGLHLVAYPISPVEAGLQDWSLVLCLGMARATQVLSPSDQEQEQNSLPPGWWDELLPSPGGWPRALHSIRTQLESAAWTVWPLFDGARVRAAIDIARGPFALVGDAAHPALPHLAQAAGMAMEDGLVLAKRLADSPSVMGLRLYGRDRRPRVVRLQAEAARQGRIYQLPAPASWARDLALRLAGPRLMRKDWLTGWRPPILD